MGGGAFQPVQDQLDRHSTRLDSSPLGIKLEVPENEWLGCLDSSNRDDSVPSGRFDEEMGEGILHYCTISTECSRGVTRDLWCSLAQVFEIEETPAGF